MTTNDNQGFPSLRPPPTTNGNQTKNKDQNLLEDFFGSQSTTTQSPILSPTSNLMSIENSEGLTSFSIFCFFLHFLSIIFFFFFFYSAPIIEAVFDETIHVVTSNQTSKILIAGEIKLNLIPSAKLTQDPIIFTLSNSSELEQLYPNPNFVKKASTEGSFQLQPNCIQSLQSSPNGYFFLLIFFFVSK